MKRKWRVVLAGVLLACAALLWWRYPPKPNGTIPAGEPSGFDLPPKQGDSQEPSTIETRLQKIINSQYAHETTDPGYVQGFRALFKELGQEGVRRLKAHPHDGVALRAAWEEVSESVQASSRGRDLDGPKLQRFLGFLEGRLHINAPSWWEKYFLSAQAYHRENIFFSIPDQAFPYSRFQAVGVGTGLSAPKGASLVKGADGLIYKSEQGSLVVPAEALDLEKVRGPIDSLSAGADTKRWYLAVHGTRGHGYPLLGVDRETGKVIWRADVWATPLSAMYTGYGYHFVTVVPHGDRVIVFGMANDVAYVEGFRAGTGECLFRTGTSY
jgi:hypothetical protein